MGQLRALLALSTLTEELLSFPISGCRSFFTAKKCTAKCSQSGFDNSKITGLGFFINVSEAEPSNFRVEGRSTHNFDTPTEETWMIANLLEFKPITIPAQYTFIGHWYLQHSGTCSSVMSSILYDISLIHQGYKLTDDVSFA